MNFTTLWSSLINQSILGLKKLDPLTTTTKSPEESTFSRILNDYIKQNIQVIRTSLTDSNSSSDNKIESNQDKPLRSSVSKITARLIAVPSSDDPTRVNRDLALINESDSPGFLASLGQFLRSTFLSTEFLIPTCLLLTLVLFTFITVSHETNR